MDLSTPAGLMIEQGGVTYHVPREVEAEGAAPAWLAGELLRGAPAEPLSRMTRAELEAESRRVGATVAPATEGADLVNADFVRANEARRRELAVEAGAFLQDDEPDTTTTDGEG
jgi:hypothetical protein